MTTLDPWSRSETEFTAHSLRAPRESLLLDVRADEGYRMRVLVRSPAIALGAIASFLACQMICPNARGKDHAAAAHESGLTEVSGSDPCCPGGKHVPTDPSEDSGCCSSCCCSGAVVNQSVTLDDLAFSIILTLPWPIPIGDLEVVNASPNLVVNLRPPEPSLRTTILLI